MERNKIRIDESKALVFQLKRERVLLPAGNADPDVNTAPNHPRYQLVYNPVKTKEGYLKLLDGIPCWKGTVILYGIKKSDRVPIGMTRSPENLRKRFARDLVSPDDTTVSRFKWMEQKLLSGDYQCLRLYVSRSL